MVLRIYAYSNLIFVSVYIHIVPFLCICLRNRLMTSVYVGDGMRVESSPAFAAIDEAVEVFLRFDRSHFTCSMLGFYGF